MKDWINQKDNDDITGDEAGPLPGISDGDEGRGKVRRNGTAVGDTDGVAPVGNPANIKSNDDRNHSNNMNHHICDIAF